MPELINCPCGQTVQGDSQEEVLDKAEQHVQADHPDMAHEYTRERLQTMVEHV